MARSLRSLEGFCMGEFEKIDPEIILLQLLFMAKFHDIVIFSVFHFAAKWQKNY